MSAINGNSRRAYITSATHQTYTWLTGEQSNNLSRSLNALDVTDKTGDWSAFIAGRKSATASITVNLDNTATAEQVDLLQGFHEGSSVYVFIGSLESNAPSEGDFFEAIVTGVNDNNDKDSVASRDISLQVTGEITHYPAFQ